MRMTMRRRPHGKFALEGAKKEGERVIEGEERRLGKLRGRYRNGKRGKGVTGRDGCGGKNSLNKKT